MFLLCFDIFFKQEFCFYFITQKHLVSPGISFRTQTPVREDLSNCTYFPSLQHREAQGTVCEKPVSFHLLKCFRGITLLNQFSWTSNVVAQQKNCFVLSSLIGLSGERPSLYFSENKMLLFRVHSNFALLHRVIDFLRPWQLHCLEPMASQQQQSYCSYH